MNIAAVRRTVRSLALLDEPPAKLCCATGHLQRHCTPAKSARRPALNPGIASDSVRPGEHHSKSTSLTGPRARNRHRPRD